MTQLNTPYPATAYLTGFLRQHAARLDLEVAQADAAIELFLKIFSRTGLPRVIAAMQGDAPSVVFVREHAERYVTTIDAVVRFLQNKDPGLALRITARDLLPEGPRFAATEQGPGSDEDDPLGWAFGNLGTTDRAKHLASLYIDDLADAIREGIAPDFELARYAERLAASAPTFDALRDALEGAPTLIDTMLDELAGELYARHKPDVIGLTAPFPGNTYSAFRIARAIKKLAPVRAILGGGYVNTELRELADPRVFDYVDFITVDDGEAPLLALIDHLRDPSKPLRRTFVREGGAVRFVAGEGKDIPITEVRSEEHTSELQSHVNL